MQKKVSFDYDGTLTLPEVQEYAKDLLARGYDIYVTTARDGYHEIDNPFLDDWNQDLYKTIDALGISRDKVIFCNNDNKFLHFKEDFLFHLDDDDYELSRIKNHSLIGVDVKKTNWKDHWRDLCEIKVQNLI